MSKHSNDPSPEQLAKLNRQRLEVEDGARAMEEAANKAIAVRERNMAWLRKWMRFGRKSQPERGGARWSSKVFCS
jgi:RNA-splicing ligase RtcB